MIACVACGASKPPNDFEKYKNGNTRKRCKTCREHSRSARAVARRQQRNLNYGIQNREKKQVYDRKRYLAMKADADKLSAFKEAARRNSIAYYYRHREKCIAKTRKWGEENPEKRAAQKKRHYRRHKQRILERDKAIRVSQKAKYRAGYVLRYELNKWKYAQSSKAWQAANTVRLTHYANKRRAAKTENGGSHTLRQWRDLVIRYGHRCYYCGRGERALTRDHIVPLNRGGGDGIDNIVPACRPCNAAKGQMSFKEFLITPWMREARKMEAKRSVHA